MLQKWQSITKGVNVTKNINMSFQQIESFHEEFILLQLPAKFVHKT